ncbi:hypothetical protein CQA37_03700 [Helicobacter sp. MIT 99-10781]|uniref:hypothetical protein n=1 Tax=Helicobacter sp. MIT 99-10781 TaxID=1332285 RepID=UPI000E203E35|nr:hypothetical protein [Helicobacter sp. MIT 99-10781]RDU55499.1 hypothetical protein CQA37_03700 [Helicobacter sp. MIT 99-10781]
MQCKICKQETQVAFNAKILGCYDEPFYKCAHCGFLSSGEAHWLDEAYKEAINLSDTGIVARNLHLYKIVACVAYFFFGFRNTLSGGGGAKYHFTRFSK